MYTAYLAGIYTALYAFATIFAKLAVAIKTMVAVLTVFTLSAEVT
jgi:hypothetical protein